MDFNESMFIAKDIIFLCNVIKIGEKKIQYSNLAIFEQICTWWICTHIAPCNAIFI